MKKIAMLLLGIAVAMQACKPFDIPDQSDLTGADVDPSVRSLAQLVVPETFLFETTQPLDINITGVDNRSNVMGEIPFELYYRDKESDDSTLVMTGRTDANGRFHAQLPFSVNTGTIIAKTNYVGLPDYIKVPVLSSRVDIAFGATNNPTQKLKDEDGNPIAQSFNGGGDLGGSGGGGTGIESDPWAYMGTVNSLGVPNYLMAQSDVVSQDILNMINASLPEGRPVPSYNPEYIDASTRSNISLTDSAEVWITFVHEGAGYRNAVGYYSYPTGSVPSSASAVSNMKIIFPNASFLNSGGGMRTGDKVSLGHFSANTTIGFFLVPDGWVPNSLKVATQSGKPVRYTNREYNTFTSAAYRPHTAVLLDKNREKVLIGFEDLNRPGGDNDFNDAVIYATFTPFKAVNQTNMVATRKYGTDKDDDGIPDQQDAFPTDKNFAFVVHWPGVNKSGTLAYEDSWPKLSDHDMNDLVLDYHIEERMNSANKINQIRYTLKVRASGASYFNGFGIELPIAARKIASVSGAHLTENYISLASNGVEAGNQKAVIIAFDNAKSFFRVNNGAYVNTEKDQPKLADGIVELVIDLSEPVTKAELGATPYNPFLIANRERGREVHLSGYHPTEKVNTAYFHTQDDDTNGTTKFYQAKNRLPWAIHIPESFKYPIEKVPINQAYLKFNQWVQSNGASYPNWYKDLRGYRNASNLY